MAATGGMQRLVAWSGGLAVIELDLEAPCAEIWRRSSPDIPIADRRRIKREEDIALVARYRPTPCKQTLTPKGIAPDIPSSLFEELSRSQDTVVTVNVPLSEWERCLGRKIRRPEIQALDGLVHLILHGQAYARRERADGGYALIPYRKFEAILGRQWASVAPAIARLIGLIETDCEWREQTEDEPGKAIGYRLTAAALSWGFTAKRMPRLMAKHLRSRRKRMAAKVSVSPRNRQAFQNLRRVTLAPAVKDELFRPHQGDTPLQVIHRIMSAAAIVRKDWFFSEDSYGRIHHNVSNLHRCVRKHLLLDGEATVQIDVGNCQPTLLWANVHKGRASPESDHMLALLTARRFYPELCRLSEKKGLTYDQEKLAVLKGLLFAKVQRDRGMVDAVKDRFPIMYTYIEDCRARGPKVLSAELQRMESRVMIRAIGHALHGAGVRSVSIHDAALVKRSQAAAGRSIFERVFKQEVGVLPAIHVEDTESEMYTEKASAAQTQTETQMDPTADLVVKSSVTTNSVQAPGVKENRVPCPADCCPGCWSLQRAIPLHSAFGCEHQPPRPVNAGMAGGAGS